RGVDVDHRPRRLADDGREGELDLRPALGHGPRLRLGCPQPEAQGGGDDRPTERDKAHGKRIHRVGNSFDKTWWRKRQLPTGSVARPAGSARLPRSETFRYLLRLSRASPSYPFPGSTRRSVLDIHPNDLVAVPQDGDARIKSGHDE